MKTEIEDLKDIAHDFYTNLYKEEKTEKNLQDKILGNVKKKLSKPQKQILDTPIT